MRAQAGDRLLTGTGGSVGLIVGVLGPEGQPPYVVKWQRSGHITMVLPDQYARIIPAGHPAGSQSSPAAADAAPEPRGGEDA
jgi:Domain of unknown function (DUF1918)